MLLEAFPAETADQARSNRLLFSKAVYGKAPYERLRVIVLEESTLGVIAVAVVEIVQYVLRRFLRRSSLTWSALFPSLT